MTDVTGGHKVSVKEAITWSLFWLGCALAFNAGLWGYFFHTSGTFYGTACWALSCFVF